MFEVFCPSHRSAVLLTTSRITAIHNTPEGLVVSWRCWCGQPGATDHTGRPCNEWLPEAS